ncbi:MAG: tetratricopeptide repeat protein [Candidatus Krumholzibacteriia bacterium]
MSKLSQLKQEAYQAAKKRNWQQAVAVYERILELDKNNPTVINELGDVCLKGGDTPAAIKHFLNAAAKYRSTGLMNNAVAIYKKILRYDADNLNAHWYLAETRASQGLSVEGENHGLHFLESSGSVSGDLKEIFLKRCNQLFELYSDSDPILERLVQIFRMWKMPLEASRAAILLACRAWDSGSGDEARRSVAQAVAQAQTVQNYPEYAQWLRRVQPPGDAGAAAFSDFGQVSLDAPAPAAPAAPIAPTREAGFGELDLTAPAAAAAAADADAAVRREGADGVMAVSDDGDDDDAIAIDDDDTISIDEGAADFDALIAEATSQLAGRTGQAAPRPQATQDDAADDPDAADAAAAATGAEPAAAAKPVDLLAEILADDSNFLAGGDSSQLESITREIGTQVGGEESDQDPASLYEMGTVYLEMGMHLQACESFAKATGAGERSYALRAYEMWGVTLQRAGRFDEAIEVLRRGLRVAPEDSPEHLGLLYNMGKSFEAAERGDEAAHAYEEIHAKDPGYLDVARRLARLTAV